MENKVLEFIQPLPFITYMRSWCNWKHVLSPKLWDTYVRFVETAPYALLFQREKASLTRKRSVVRIHHRVPFIAQYSVKEAVESVKLLPIGSLGAVPRCATNLLGWRTRSAQWSEKPPTMVQLHPQAPLYTSFSTVLRVRLISVYTKFDSLGVYHLSEES